jgi:long-subunit acyl-CoA synthetase (AMP-forming)
VSFNDVGNYLSTLKKLDIIYANFEQKIHYTSLYLSIIGSGACSTGANPGYTASELIHHLRMTDAKLILTERKTLNVSIAAAKECQIPDNKIFALNFRNEVVSGYQSWNTLLDFGEKYWVKWRSL